MNRYSILVAAETMAGRFCRRKLSLDKNGATFVTGLDTQHSFATPAETGAKHVLLRGEFGKYIIPESLVEELQQRRDRDIAALESLVTHGDPLYRWSDGGSFAVEFTAGDECEFERKLGDALTEARVQFSSSARLEMHVRCGSYWFDPCFPRPGGGIEAFGQTILSATSVHVITLPRHAPDPDPVPKIRGTDFVLIIGPTQWHTRDLFAACECARFNERKINCFFAGLGETLETFMGEDS